MNLFFGIVLLIISTFVGYVCSSKFSDRQVFYLDFLNFNKKLKQEVAFKQSTILTIVNKLNNNSDFNITTKDFFSKNELNFNKKYLTEEEKNYFYDYLREIGKTEKNYQIEYLNATNETLTLKQKACEEDAKKYKKLYIKIGFLIGLILLILVL